MTAVMTIKLYWNDSHLTEFTARVQAVDAAGKSLTLDRTAFYPTGGGQPHDVGVIGAARVGEVALTDDGRILHYVDDATLFAAGDEVRCKIDRPRRRELTQQHTGQHILSQAFFQLFGAETRGFRLSERTAEIDLALDLAPESIAAAVTQAEGLANAVVFDDREVRSHELTPEEAARLPLRKEGFVAGAVRVVEIEDFDYSPCGGTHARRTGEVGLIAVRRFERAKRMTRVEFACGVRALNDYRAANTTASAVAARFSVGRDQAAESVGRLLDEHRQLQRRARELGELAAKVEADEIVNSLPATPVPRLVVRVFAGRGFDEVKALAHRLAARDSVVALLASREGDATRLVFARSADVPADMGVLMKAACEQLGGRGGGAADFAQGGCPCLAELEAVLGEIAGRVTGGQ
jgi:alanyl-tRNA synthetase